MRPGCPAAIRVHARVRERPARPAKPPRQRTGPRTRRPMALPRARARARRYRREAMAIRTDLDEDGPGSVDLGRRGPRPPLRRSAHLPSTRVRRPGSTLGRAARRFLVARHLLAPPRSLPAGPEGVLAAFERLGVGPVRPARRRRAQPRPGAPRARPDYRAGLDRALLYETRELFETYNKGLSLLPTAELPWYRVAWDAARGAPRARPRSSATRDTVEHVLERIRAEGPAEQPRLRAQAASSTGTGAPRTRCARCSRRSAEAGVLGLARREGNRRYYDLVERLYPAELLAIRPRAARAAAPQAAVALPGRRPAGHGWPGGALVRHRPGRAASRGHAAGPVDARPSCARSSSPTASSCPCAVEGLRGLRFVARRGAAQLDGGRGRRQGPGSQDADPAVTFLAPLDPLVWDRDLLRGLFGFDYVWEVYVPEPKRRWGYYVLPILFGDRFVGRIEPRIDRASGVVRRPRRLVGGGLRPAHGRRLRRRPCARRSPRTCASRERGGRVGARTSAASGASSARARRAAA